jgi:hypothetical protein
MADNVEYFRPQPGDTPFQCLWRVEAELERRGFSIGPCQGTMPRGIMPAEYAVAKWRNLSKQERAELAGVMTFVGRPREPDQIIVTWSKSVYAHKQFPNINGANNG